MAPRQGSMGGGIHNDSTSAATAGGRQGTSKVFLGDRHTAWGGIGGDSGVRRKGGGAYYVVVVVLTLNHYVSVDEHPARVYSVWITEFSYAVYWKGV